MNKISSGFPSNVRAEDIFDQTSQHYCNSSALTRRKYLGFSIFLALHIFLLQCLHRGHCSLDIIVIGMNFNLRHVVLFNVQICLG